MSVGDSVKQGQPIAEVSTDKVDMDLEAPFDGVIASLDAEPGAAVELGGLMATATTDSEDLLGGLVLDVAPAETTPPPPEAPAPVVPAAPTGFLPRRGRWPARAGGGVHVSQNEATSVPTAEGSP